MKPAALLSPTAECRKTLSSGDHESRSDRPRWGHQFVAGLGPHFSQRTSFTGKVNRGGLGKATHWAGVRTSNQLTSRHHTASNLSAMSSVSTSHGATESKRNKVDPSSICSRYLCQLCFGPQDIAHQAHTHLRSLKARSPSPRGRGPG